MPASASRVHAWKVSGVHSSGWTKCRLIHKGWCFRSMRHKSRVMRWGSTAGILVPRRMNSTCGIARNSRQQPVQPLLAQEQRVAAGEEHVADGGRAADVVQGRLPGVPGWARSRPAPPPASGCNSGSNSSTCPGPATARGPDSDGPSPARGCRVLRPRDRRPRRRRGPARGRWERRCGGAVAADRRGKSGSCSRG